MSSPLRPGASLGEELEYYKKQYEQLETDLAEFQASSKELEEQLERDIEAAEKNERKLKAQIEKLKYEAEEWKTKHQQAKVESNNAQNALQKEITAMRETNRALQMKLRDIEVVNDDYERQARNTESSLEDMESKYSVAIERGVLMDGELKSGEQEREGLRIETQRLRDELGDLKVESEITLEKLRLADDTIERLRSRKPSPLAVESLRARSPGSEASAATPSSPTASTPPPKSDTASDAPTPPSPPLSDAPPNSKVEPRTPVPGKRRSLIPDAPGTIRSGYTGSRSVAKHSRGPSATSNGSGAATDNRMKPPARPRQISRPSFTPAEPIPRTDSLYQIRNLRGRMQKIEERVHSARSKLPGPPKDRTPKNSPNTLAEMNDHLPTSVTTRRSIKRPSSNLGAFADIVSDAASEPTVNRRESNIKRLSFGIPRPASVAAGERPPSAFDRPPSAFDRPPSAFDRPPSALDRPPSAFDRPPSAASRSRPSSRASLASSTLQPPTDRPSSRAGARTPSALPARSNSSLGGASYATIHGTPRSHHRPSASISSLRHRGAESEDSGLLPSAGSPGRRGTLNRSLFATPTASTASKSRQSGVGAAIPTPRTAAKRVSTGFGASVNGDMRPPPPSTTRTGTMGRGRKMSDVGETY